VATDRLAAIERSAYRYIEHLRCSQRGGEAEPVKVGVNLLNFGPGVSPERLADWAHLAEALGYHSVLISDHVAITPDVAQRYPEPYYDSFTTLAWLAAQTKRVRLGTTVCVLPYRHPILTARLVGNIDRLSGGRFIFGVGVGNAAAEFQALGVPHRRRGILADECLQAMQLLWTQVDPVSFDGRLVHFEGVSPIGTVQQPYPPVWVGGSSDEAIKRAARLGNAWHPILRSLDGVREVSLPLLQRYAAEAGRPVPAFCPRIRLDLQEESLHGERMPGVGSLKQVEADLRTLEELGAAHVILDWYTGDLSRTRDHNHGWQMLALLADRVLDLHGETWVMPQTSDQ
jgi:probable F420-dependent oxidoreductase